MTITPGSDRFVQEYPAIYYLRQGVMSMKPKPMIQGLIMQPRNYQTGSIRMCLAAYRQVGANYVVLFNVIKAWLGVAFYCHE